ncbi:MAG: methyl-accepting chemotaxis protein [Desulfuromonadales bacterium]
MKNMNIGTRIGFCFSLILLMLITITGISYYNVTTLETENNLLIKDEWVKNKLLKDVNDNMDDIFIASHSMALAADPETLKREDAHIGELSDKTVQDMERLDKIILSDSGRRFIAATKLSRDSYKEECNRFRELLKSGLHKEAVTLLTGPVTTKKKSFDKAVHDFIIFQEQEVERIGLKAVKLSSTTNTVSLLLAALAVLAGIILARYLANSITKPIAICSDAAERISNGNTSVDVDVSAQDEIGALQRSMAKMSDSLKMMINDGTALASAAVAGKLMFRSDVSNHQGDFRTVIQGFNDTLDTVITPINEVRSVMEGMAVGDLRLRMQADVQGDLAVLKQSLNNALVAISTAIANVTQNARQVAAASAQTSGAVGQISDGSQNQLHAIGQVATAIKQTASAIADVSRNTEEASRRAKESVAIVGDGQVKMAQMIKVVNNIAANSEKINKITDVIEKIANKTNLLSLNAAIEAARAGEHGRGFAVVAEEVGKLAANAAESTQEIVALVNQAVKEANHAVSTVNEVSEGMRMISDGALQSESMLQRVATALEEQSAAVQEINVNIASLNKVAESNAAASEEITATVVELARIADNTRREAEQFKL